MSCCVDFTGYDCSCSYYQDEIKVVQCRSCGSNSCGEGCEIATQKNIK